MMGAKQKKTAVKQTFTFPAPLTNRNGEVMHISKTSATQIVEEISKLENVTDYFAEEFYRIIHNIGGILTSVEASETPTRSYIINMEEQEENAGNNEETENKIMSDVIDAVLNGIVDTDKE